ncbi:heme o synthase [Paramagnetospirillum magneticum]|uniref:Protoheme IX farnesyltransferase 1 n=1 Tax=Paramagnetospirillum magneticum (strain ATCC 700264 / AMB-1) TaxID=342108 RepID=COXX1_PARM1|nr:heme o synthase [Paramagnetospirillum magneticum]Q2W9D1.2 RecName: Full=Protoheme IX farnesyltransferase 1; AltName: Full=Heme B farnesyltransferase 1; AltName: Full=Heme O synthase 1 [Paramagnetospirillum magneticum AMB-1]
MTFRQYIELLKPRIALMIALTAITGYGAVATKVDPVALLLLTLAMILGSAASAVFNHVWDRDIDRLMRRTSRRPMATGAGTPALGFALAVVLMVAGMALANAAFNWVVALHLFLGGFVYVAIYTVWLKRRHWTNIIIGGAAGSFAVLAGAAAVDQTQWLLPMVLALVLFLWTPSHFWSLAILLADDYRQAGVPMLPVVVGAKRTAWCILANTVILVGASLLPWGLGLLGNVYGFVAAVSGAVLLGFNVVLVRDTSRRWAGWNFAASMPYLLLLFIAVFADKHW